ncbi:MAG TPA: thiamine diphosphokinase, partial [Caldithrix sp.]|nr:thiamine diphosphokinase [Caldithrix sp.]
MSEKIIAIVANGRPLESRLAVQAIKSASVIIAADGGAIACKKSGIKPDFIIGDFDSISRDTLNHFKDAEVIHIQDQYSTDMEKALHFATSLKPDRLIVLSAFGKRMDHTSANLLFLTEYNEKIPVEIYDNHGCMTILKEGKHKFNYKPGTLISFFSPYPVKNLTLKGFRYNLQHRNY